jgi:hypothetical protein
MSRWSWWRRAMTTDKEGKVQGDNDERMTSANATIAAK